LNSEEIIAQLVLLVHSDKLVVKTTPVNLNVPYKFSVLANNSKVSSVTRLTLLDAQVVNALWPITLVQISQLAQVPWLLVKTDLVLPTLPLALKKTVESMKLNVGMVNVFKTLLNAQLDLCVHQCTQPCVMTVLV